jgi:hypothetical protein
MLTAQEREVVTEAVALYLSRQDQMRAVVASLVDDQDFELHLPSPSEQTPMRWARVIIDYCEADGWRHVPPWLFNLLSRMQPARVDLRPVIERIRGRPPRWIGGNGGDALDTLWLGRSGMPFIDRRLLRDHVRHMALSVTGPRILVVTGATQSGKSYTIELLDHFAREQQSAAFELPPGQRPVPAAVAVANVPRGSGATASPLALVRQLADFMLTAGVTPPGDNAAPNRQNEYLAQWVLEQAAATGKQWWLVLDGLDDPDLTDEAGGFISKLAQRVARSVDEPSARLVLLGYPPVLVSGVEADWLASEQVGPIGEVDLEPFFTELLIGAGARALTPATVKTAVFVLLKDLPANGDRMRCLNQALRESVARVCHA